MHDEGRVLVALLTEGIEFCSARVSGLSEISKDKLTSNGVIKRLLGKMAGLVGRVENLVVEHGKVQRQAEADGVCRSEVGLRNVGGCLVRLEGLVGRGLALVAKSELGKVAVVVALPVIQLY